GAGQKGLADNGYIPIPDAFKARLSTSIDAITYPEVVVTRGTAISPSTAEKPALTTLSEHVGRRADRLFKLSAAAAGSTIVVAILLIAVFLLLRAVPSLRVNHVNFFTSAKFSTSDPNQLAFGIRDLLMVTVLSSLSALVLAVPVAVGIAVFLTQYAPKRL